MPTALAAVGFLSATGKKSIRFCLFAAFMTLLSLVVGFRHFHQVRNHLALGSLDSSEISRIEIGEAALIEIANGGWTETVTLVVTFEDGRTLRFRVADNGRQEGAVIEFFRGSDRSYWHDGYAFCPRLPTVLRELGVQLPS